MQSEATSAAWYVAETITRGEEQAQRNLERQGFTSFCPRFRKLRRHARRTDHHLAPVFPGYVFVRFDRQRDGWHAINGTTGVKRLIGPTGSRPQSMPAPAMQALLERCSGDIIAGLFTTLEPGQPVRILSGPFANLLAEVEQLDAQGRVRVLLNLLGGATPVALRISEVGPV
jgi:transcriptional antiterminator RfaH